MTPADRLVERTYDPFCGNGVLATINELADFSHSRALADLVAEGKWKGELLITLGKVAPPRYANFIGRYKDDADPLVRRAVAVALGLIDNEAITVPVLIQLLGRGDQKDDFSVKWDAAGSLIKVARRPGAEGARRRLLGLLQERDAVTVALAARALAAVGDARGLLKLQALASHSDPRVREEAVLFLGEAADKGSTDIVTRRLKDESLAVRASAIYALGRIAGASVIPTLRKALEESIEYEKELERRKQRGQSETVLAEKYGLGVFDLRETLQEAIAQAEKSGGR